MKKISHIVLLLILAVPLVLPAGAVMTLCVDLHGHDHHATPVTHHGCEGHSHCEDVPPADCSDHVDLELEGADALRVFSSSSFVVLAPLTDILPATERLVKTTESVLELVGVAEGGSPPDLPVLSRFLL